MKDQGFSGSGSRFVPRFKAGSPIYADQLNDLATGLGVTLSQPYIGSGPSVSFTGGGSIITNPDNSDLTLGLALQLIDGNEYVNHYEIAAVYKYGVGALLKVAKGGNVWRPELSTCTTNLRADAILTDGSIAVVMGTNPLSPWASNDGYIVMTPGTTYYAYAFKVETAFGSFFYIYVSTSAALAYSCPVPLPTGIPVPGTAYTVQAVLLGSATVADPLVPVPFVPVIDQFNVGAITWPNLGGAGTEYVNHYEAKRMTVDVEGTSVVALKVAKGGNVWMPTGSKCADELRVDTITPDPSGPSPVTVVTGSDITSPWASSDGYVPMDAANDYYIYAFKVETDTSTAFYIYVSKTSTLVDSCPIALPPGITEPTSPYTVQGLKVAQAIWDGTASEHVMNQRVVGSITWPPYVPPSEVRQFEVRTIKIEGVDYLQVAKGDILWSYSHFTGSAHDATPLQGHAKKLWVYPSGTLTTGPSADSPWVNDGGYLSLSTDTTYGVYIIGNQDSDYFGGAVSLAVIATGSDAYTKTRPFRSGYMGRGWESVFKNGLVVDGSPIYSPFYEFDRLKNYNCQRYLVATVAWDGTGWKVSQYLYGPVTLSNDLDDAGPKVWESDPPGPDFQTEQDAWTGSWTGYTKDGSPTDTVDIVWVS